MQYQRRWLAVALIGLVLGAVGGLRGAAPADAKQDRTDLYGDPLPADALVRLGTIRWRHSGPILSVAYLGDGKQMITGSQDGTLRIWEAATGRELRSFGKAAPAANANVDLRRRVYLNMMSAIALAPDGQALVSAGQDGTITLWDVATGKELRSWKTNPPQGVHAIMFSADGKSVIAKAYNQMLIQYAVEDGKELRRITNVFNPQQGKKEQLYYGGNPAGSMALADDGKTLVVGAMFYDQNKVTSVLKRWELDTGKELPSWKGPDHNGLQSLAISPDAKVCVVGINDGSIRLWDTATGKELRQFANPQQGGYPMAMNFSPDGTRVATRGQDQTVRIWDLATGKELHVLGGNGQGGVGALGYSAGNLAFSADGKSVAAPTGAMTIRQWDVATGKDIGLPPSHMSGIAAVVVAKDGKSIVTRGQDNTVRTWESATGKELAHFSMTGNNGLSAFSPDGRVLVVMGYDSVCRVWDVAAGKELLQWKLPVNNFQALAVSPDGKVLAARSYDMIIRTYELATGKELKQIAFLPPAAGGAGAPAAPGKAFINPGMPVLTFSPDSTMIAANAAGNAGMIAEQLQKDRAMPGGVSNAIIIYDAATGKVLRRFEPSPVGMSTFTFAPDGRTIASGNLDGTISLWEIASGKERCQFKAKPADPRQGKEELPAEKAKEDAKMAYIAVPQNQRSIMFLSYAPDGKVLIGGGLDRVLRCWDAQTGAELKNTTGHVNNISCLAVAADGKSVVTGSLDTTALVWKMDDVKPEPVVAVDVDEARVEALWKDLAGDDAKKAYEAVRTLGLGNGPVLPALRDRVKPVLAPDAKKVAQLIADLDSNMFAVRQKSTEELERLGELVEPDLKRVLEGQPTLEMKMRVDKLLERLVTAAPPSSEELRALRVIEILQLQGTAESKDALTALTKGAAGARLTRFAQSALNHFVPRS